MELHEATPPPVPPRFWWLKRILIASGCFLVFLVALRLWWGWEADRRLKAEIDRIIAAGEPIYPEDFNPKEDLPDEQNAAKLYLDAQENFVLTTDQIKIVEDVRTNPTAIAANGEAVRTIIEDNADALRLIRRARSLDQADWGMRFRSPVMSPNRFPNLEGERQLGKFMQAAAIHSAHAGDDKECIEFLLDIVALGRCLRRHPEYVAQITAWGIDSCAIRGIEELVATFVRFKEHAAVPPTPEQLRALLRALSDDAELADGMRQGWLVSRMGHLDLILAIDRRMTPAQGGLSGMIASPQDILANLTYRPVFPLDMVKLSRDFEQRLERLRRGLYVRRAEPDGSMSMFDSALQPFHTMLRDSHDHAERMYYRHLAWRRLAAMGLAARMYRLERGTLPGALEDLVPGYLDAIPRDPLHPDGRPVMYLPNADPPIVYSVGTDGVDDGGHYENRGGYVFGYKYDLPFFLDGGPPSDEPEDKPPPTPSGEAEEDADDAEQTEGQSDEDQEPQEDPE